MTPKILIIDDDSDTEQLLRSSLSPLKFDIISVVFDENAAEIAKNLTPDIFIIGITSTWQTGLDLCKYIRTFSNAPIIILSALKKPNLVAKFLDAGADDFIIRPVKRDVLIAHIKGMTRWVRT